jgi:hypothetical protein
MGGNIMIMAYFKNENGDLFVDPIEKNHSGLTKITQNKFNQLLTIKNAPPEKTQNQIDGELKMAGVLIEGVMCSATTQDSNGLLAVNVWLSGGGSTRFEFENGNNLLLTPENKKSFGDVWMPFRQSFWKSE